MPRRTTVVIVRNDIKPTAARIHKNLVARVEEVTETGRDVLHDNLAGGALPLQPDTQALAESLSIQTGSGTDFNERRDAAKSAYLNNASRYKDAVQREVDPNAYTEGHFEDRAARQPPDLAQGRHVARAAILTMLVYGMYWEFGHHNVFTDKEEQRPWFYGFLLDWWAREAANAFSGLAN